MMSDGPARKRGKAAWVDSQNGLLLHEPAPFPGMLSLERNLNLLLNIGQVAAMYQKALLAVEGDLKFEYELEVEEDGWVMIGVGGFHVLGCDPSRVRIERFCAALADAKERGVALTAGSFPSEIGPFLIGSTRGLPRGPFAGFFFQQAMSYVLEFVVWPRFRKEPRAALEYVAGWSGGSDPQGLLSREPLIASLIADADDQDRKKVFRMLSRATASALQAKAGTLEEAWKSFDAAPPR